MFNERLCLIWRPMAGNWALRRDNVHVESRNLRDVMTGGIATFLAAVGGTSLVCYWLANRADGRKARRQSASGDSGGSYDSGSSSGDGSSIFSWFSSDHS